GTGAAPVTVEEYDPGADRWEARASMPSGREQLAATSRGDRIYAVGGFSGVNVSAPNEEYSPAADSWRKRAPMPGPRSALGLTLRPNGLIYAIGGHITIYRSEE